MLALVLLLAASSAQASARAGTGSDNLVAALGPFRPQVGAWAEYLIRSRGDQDVRVRLAAVGPDLGRARAWIEVATVGSQSFPFAARLLLNAATGKLERASVYALGQAPIEVPVDGGEVASAAFSHVVPGITTVRVPAGTFTTTERRVVNGTKETRIWRTDEVPLWGLVRAREPGRTIELLRFGRAGARSLFPGSHGNGSESAKE
jgi:hypothetical protein